MKTASEVNITTTDTRRATILYELQIWNIPRFAKKNLRRLARRIDSVIEIPRFDVNRIERERCIIYYTYIYILCTPHDIHLVRFISSNERNFKNYKYRWILRKHSRLRKNNIVVSLYTVNKWASLHARRDSFIASTWTVTKKAMPPSFLLRHFGATRSGPGKKRYPPLATI